MDDKRLEELYGKESAEMFDGIQNGIVVMIRRRLAIGNPVYFGILPYYTDAATWKTFNGGKLTLQEEYALKEVFIGLPIYTTFVVLDEAEKDGKGKSKLCIQDAVPESVQGNKQFLEYHTQCVKKLILDWKDNVVHRKGDGGKYRAT